MQGRSVLKALLECKLYRTYIVWIKITLLNFTQSINWYFITTIKLSLEMQISVKIKSAGLGPDHCNRSKCFRSFWYFGCFGHCHSCLWGLSPIPWFNWEEISATQFLYQPFSLLFFSPVWSILIRLFKYLKWKKEEKRPEWLNKETNGYHCTTVCSRKLRNDE